MRSSGMRLSPRVRGIAGLTSAITRRAVSAAARVTSTEMPRLHIPSPSGGATWISATSTVTGFFAEMARDCQSCVVDSAAAIVSSCGPSSPTTRWGARRGLPSGREKPCGGVVPAMVRP